MGLAGREHLKPRQPWLASKLVFNVLKPVYNASKLVSNALKPISNVLKPVFDALKLVFGFKTKTYKWKVNPL